jgi:hypothetical protein
MMATFQTTNLEHEKDVHKLEWYVICMIVDVPKWKGLDDRLVLDNNIWRLIYIISKQEARFEKVKNWVVMGIIVLFTIIFFYKLSCDRL